MERGVEREMGGERGGTEYEGESGAVSRVSRELKNNTNKALPLGHLLNRLALHTGRRSDCAQTLHFHHVQTVLLFAPLLALGIHVGCLEAQRAQDAFFVLVARPYINHNRMRVCLESGDCRLYKAKFAIHKWGQGGCQVARDVANLGT